MEINQNKELNTIKLIKGRLGRYGWEIKLVGNNPFEIKKQLDKLNKEMEESYNLNQIKEVK